MFPLGGIPWKLVSYALCGVIFMFAGAALDHHYFVRPLQAQLDKISAEYAQAKTDYLAEKAQKEAEYAKNFADIRDGYDATVARLRRQYGAASHQHLPQAAANPQVVNGSGTECVSAESAAIDAAAVTWFQEYVIRNDIPVQ